MQEIQFCSDIEYLDNIFKLQVIQSFITHSIYNNEIAEQDIYFKMYYNTITSVQQKYDQTQIGQTSGKIKALNKFILC